MNDRPYKRYYTSNYTDNATNNGSTFSENFETGAMCIPDGFPCIVYHNGDFWGVNSFQLKKDCANYQMEDDNPDNIHIDSDVYRLWSYNGVIDWSTDERTGFNNNIYGSEIRNPEDLYCIDGTVYDPDINRKEIANTETINQWISDGILPDGTEITKKIKTRLQTTAKVRTRFEEMTTYGRTLRTMMDSGESEENIRSTFMRFFDLESFIDYFLLSNVTYNTDAFGNNGQLVSWGKRGNDNFV